MSDMWSRLSRIELSLRVQLAAGAGGVVCAGRRAGRDHRALFPQAAAPAGPGAEHDPVAAEPGRPARQQSVPAAAAQPALVPPAPGGGPGDAGPGRPADEGHARPGAAVRALDRQLGEHVGHRRRAQPAGQGQGGGQEDRRRDGRRRPGDGDRVRRQGAGRFQLHRRPPRCSMQRIDAIEPTQATTSLREGLAGRRRAGQSLEADRRGRRRVVGRHPQAVHLYRRRLRRRRGLQPGQSRARGGRDRASSASLFAPGRGDAAPPTAKSGLATRPTTWRSWPSRPGATKTSPRSTSSSAASTTSAPRRSRPRPSSTATRPTSPETKGRWSTRSRSRSPLRAISRSSSTCPTPG